MSANDRPLLYFGILRLDSGGQRIHELCVDTTLTWQEKHMYGIPGFLLEAIRDFAKDVPPGARRTQEIKKEKEKEAIPFPPALIHTFHHPDGLFAALVSSPKYDLVAAQMIMNKSLEQFLEEHPRHEWQSGTKTFYAPKIDGENICTKFKDPSQINKIAGIQKDLDETMDTLRKAIQQTTVRGEHLDSLFQKSENLNTTSKMFYQQAKKQNSCCVLM